MATPNIKKKAMIKRSMFDFGWKSPNPTVERDVKLKYQRAIMSLFMERDPSPFMPYKL